METEFIHLTASELIRWNEISSSDNKLVNNITDTQERLLYALNKRTTPEYKYLLDGHFCLSRFR